MYLCLKNESYLFCSTNEFSIRLIENSITIIRFISFYELINYQCLEKTFNYFYYKLKTEIVEKLNNFRILNMKGYFSTIDS